MMSYLYVMSRQEEITSHFLRLADQHVDDLLHGRIDRRFTANDFAKMLFIHSRHLTDTVKVTTGRSPCDYMEEKVITEAKKMLKDTTLSIADIGGRFAYNDPSNFTKFFKTMTGITPMQYRKGLAGT